MLFVVYRVIDKCSVHLPYDEAFQSFEEVVGEGDRAKRLRFAIVVLAGFGNKNDLGFFPEFGGVSQVNGRFVGQSEGVDELRWEVFEDQRFDIVWPGTLLLFEPVQGLADKGGGDPVLVFVFKFCDGTVSSVVLSDSDVVGGSREVCTGK